MITEGRSLAEVLRIDEAELLHEWIEAQLTATGMRSELMSRHELQEQSRKFLAALRAAVEQGVLDTSSPAFVPVCHLLEDMSTTRAMHGYTPSETATFVLSL